MLELILLVILWVLIGLVVLVGVARTIAEYEVWVANDFSPTITARAILYTLAWPMTLVVFSSGRVKRKIAEAKHKEFPHVFDENGEER